MYGFHELKKDENESGIHTQREGREEEAQIENGNGVNFYTVKSSSPFQHHFSIQKYFPSSSHTWLLSLLLSLFSVFMALNQSHFFHRQ